MTKYFTDMQGKYLGGFDCDPEFYPQDFIEVPFAPDSASDTWNGTAWVRDLKIRNAQIEAQRAVRYKAEVDIYAVRLVLNQVTKEFVQAIRDKIKSELPYEVEG